MIARRALRTTSRSLGSGIDRGAVGCAAERVIAAAVAICPLSAAGLAGGHAGLAGVELLVRWRFGCPLRIRAGHRREACADAKCRRFRGRASLTRLRTALADCQASRAAQPEL